MGDSVFDLLDTIEAGEDEQRLLDANYSSHGQKSWVRRDCSPDPQHSPSPASLSRRRQLEHWPQQMHLDAFDQDVLAFPPEERARQAAQGRARLSLARSYTGQAVDQRDSDSPGPFRRYGVNYVPSLRFPRREEVSSTEARAETALTLSSSPRMQITPSSPASQAGRRLQEQRRQRFIRDHDSQLEMDDHLDFPDIDAPNHTFEPEYISQRQNTTLPKGTPIIRGISLVPCADLPDRFRTILPFRLFNAVQSKCFNTVFRTNDNFVLASPTGSGKTVIFELAICRVIAGFSSDNFKVVYQAPTKSLCAERQKDWQAKFGPLGAHCVEITGDTNQMQMKNVGGASIIVTTPEKWDSMTRKWKDHRKLMKLVRLFLIDEVHIVKENRGATLEAVVSRMKAVAEDIRFIALSATVPNSDDIAEWLGRDSSHQGVPAARETFGEDFRPVKLQKHVAAFPSNGNDYQFDRYLDSKLSDIISKHSKRKPLMVFCSTRKSTEITAGLLSNWWKGLAPRERYWSSPRKSPFVEDTGLQATVSAGVAFHHAGLSQADRHAVERGFLEGEVNAICCTGTLAMGVNLPCHFVIIKSTVTYQNPTGVGREYSDLEIMQMLGRAGRPQFDDSAVAVIMTRSERAKHYEKMMSGQEVLESCLHLNLIEHLNAEIGLGTIYDIETARNWLQGTFLHIRLQKNPEHYRLQGDAMDDCSLEDRLGKILSTNIASLHEHELVQYSSKLQSSEYGDAMARYYVQFETMKFILGLPPKAKISEILSAVAQAAEFQDIRFRGGEKLVYKEINRSTSIKFPIPVDLALPAHKVSLIIQTVLGSVDLPNKESQPKVRLQYQTDQSIIFQHVHRLIRCTIDCALAREDSMASRNGLMLARSLAARAWDDSPLQLKQLDKVGIVAVRKLVTAGIRTIEELETAEAHRLETILGRATPFGMRLLDQARAFPKLRVSVQIQGQAKRQQDGSVMVKVHADIGLLNETVPSKFNNREVYVCFLAETSDGRKIHFCRTKGSRLSKGFDILFSASLTNSNQTINCYVMCDELAGTMRQASLKPQIPLQLFASQKALGVDDEPRIRRHSSIEKPNTSKRRIDGSYATDTPGFLIDDEFGDEDIPDFDLIKAAAAGSDFVHIDELEKQQQKRRDPVQAISSKRRKTTQGKTKQPTESYPSARLENGKWACKHRCKNKMACKHLCCREGLDSPPKPTKPETIGEISSTQRDSERKTKQQSIDLSLSKQKTKSRPTIPHTAQLTVESIDLTQASNSEQRSSFQSQLPKDGTEASITDFDPWTLAEEIPKVLPDSDDVPNPPRAVSPNRSRPSLYPIDDDDDAAARKPLPELQLDTPLNTYPGPAPRYSNWLFNGNTSSPATDQATVLNTVRREPPKSVEDDAAPDPETGVADKLSNIPDAEESYPSKSMLLGSSSLYDMPVCETAPANKENERPTPNLEGVETWFLEEFGDIVELV